MPCQWIQKAIEEKFIRGASLKNISPASLDLSLSEEVFRVDGIVQPRLGERIENLLACLNARPHDLSSPLELGVVYLAKLNESLALPENVYGFCNPKSSTGRDDVHVRVMTDGIPRYDFIYPPGFHGDLWIVINPKSFPVKLSPGEKLSQVRFFNKDTRFNEPELAKRVDADKLVWHSGTPLSYSDLKVSNGDGSLILTAAVSEAIGWHSIYTRRVMDFSKWYAQKDFFEPVVSHDGHILLRRGEFYILSTRESIRVPPWLACEMVPMDERSGDFRSHYAGFIDPGWGWGKNGEGKGRPITLEVRPFEDMLVRDNQPIARVRFEEMTENPRFLYDEMETSHYVVQNGPRLSKRFNS